MLQAYSLEPKENAMKPRGGNFIDALNFSLCEGLKEAGLWSLVFLKEWRKKNNQSVHFSLLKYSDPCLSDYLALSLLEKGYKKKYMQNLGVRLLEISARNLLVEL